MKIAQICILATLIPLICGTFLVLKFVFKKQMPRLVSKILAGCLGVVFFVRYMSGDDLISETIAGVNSIFASSALSKFAVVLVWFTYAAILLAVFQPFFKIDVLKSLVKFFVLPFSIVAAFCIQISSQAILGANWADENSFRCILMAIEIVLMFAISLDALLDQPRVKFSWKGVLKFFAFLALAIFSTMPSYSLQAFFGHPTAAVNVKSFTYYHRLALYGAVLIPFILHFALRKQNEEVIRFALLFICVGTLMTYSFTKKFEDFATVTNLPLHLCNTAMYILPLCLLFKWDKLFYFTYFINVFGAFIAMMLPNYSTALNFFSTTVVSFYVNHYIAFFMPILMVSLHVFPRPKLKQFIYSMVAFVVYFLFIVFINAWFSNYGTVDYFFLNSDFIVSKLGTWAEKTRNFVWSFSIGDLTFTFYPLYQSLFCIVYMAIGAGVWFVFEQCYQIADTYTEMRHRTEKIKIDKILLKERIANMSEEEKMKRENREASIKLTNFTKRYGSSDCYAVKDANLNIRGGQIYGFLGPNGAGKSTIIKSIVGIQPITEGSIEICGFDVEKEATLAKSEVGFVPDHYALYEKLTGREYINYIADLYGVSVADRTAAMDKYVKLFELEGAFDNQIKTYSHGMKQKIAIMSALVHNPKIWILDEPLTGLDPNSIFQVKECMKQHASEGNVVFFSSHIIDVVERICDRIGIIKKGQILVEKDVKDILQSGQSLEDFYMQTIESGSDEAVKFSKAGSDSTGSGAVKDLSEKQELDVIRKICKEET